MSARRSSRSWNRNAVASISVPRKYAPPVSGCDTNWRYLSAARIRCRELFGMSSLTASSSSARPVGAPPIRARIRRARSTLATGDSSVSGTMKPALPSHQLLRFRYTES